jgi:flagellar motor protein MotB
MDALLAEAQPEHGLAAPRLVPEPSTPDGAQALAGAVGNARFTSLAARSRAALQRCPDGSDPSCPCARDHHPAAPRSDDAELWRALRRAAAARGPGPSVASRASTRALQRLSEVEKQEQLGSPKLAGNERLERAFDNSPALHIGESGPAVRLVQEVLVSDGFPMPASTKPTGDLDGGFGQETFDVLNAFQAKHGLEVDGIIGRQTLRVMDNLAGSESGQPPLLKPKPGVESGESLGLPGLEVLTPGELPIPGVAGPNVFGSPPADDVQAPNIVTLNDRRGLIAQIFFPTNESALDDTDFRDLQKVIDAQFPRVASGRRVNMQFHGHADFRTSSKGNFELSAARAQNCADFVGNQFRLNDPATQLPRNLDLLVVAHGAIPRLHSGGGTSADLAGFRRVDVFAEPFTTAPPKPPEDREPRRPTDRWLVKFSKGAIICDAARPKAGAASGALLLTIHDRQNNVGQDFTLVGGGACSGTPLKTFETASFIPFSTDFPIHINQFAGFANWSHGAAGVSVIGVKLDIVTLLGPEACCGAGTVVITVPSQSQKPTNPDPKLSVGGATILGTLDPLGAEFPLAK